MAVRASPEDPRREMRGAHDARRWSCVSGRKAGDGGPTGTRHVFQAEDHHGSTEAWDHNEKAVSQGKLQMSHITFHTSSLQEKTKPV